LPRIFLRTLTVSHLIEPITGASALTAHLKEGAYCGTALGSAQTQTFSAMPPRLGISALCIVRHSSEIMTKVSRWAHCHWPLKPKSPDPVRQNPIASVLKRDDAPRHGIPKPLLTPSSDLLEIRHPPACMSASTQKKACGTMSPIFPMLLFRTSCSTSCCTFLKLSRSLFLTTFLSKI